MAIDPKVLQMMAGQNNQQIDPGQYPQSYYEPGGRFHGADSIYNAAFDSAEAAYLATNPAMTPELANKLFPQNTPDLNTGGGGLMDRTNEQGLRSVPTELPGVGGGGFYNDPSKVGDVLYQDPSTLVADPSIQQMTNPLGADLSPSLGPVSDEVQPPPQAPPLNTTGGIMDSANRQASLNPTLHAPGTQIPSDKPIRTDNSAPQVSRLQLADQYLADNSASKWENYNTATDADRDFMKGKINPATAGNLLTDQTDLNSLVPQPAGGGMSLEDATAMLAGQKTDLPPGATPTTTGGPAGDSSVVTPVVETTAKKGTHVMPGGTVMPGETHTEVNQSGEPTTKTSIKAGKPIGTPISTTTSGGGLDTTNGVAYPSVATTGTDASSGGVNIGGLYDDASKGKGIAGTSNIDYTNTPAPDPNIDYSKVDPMTGEPTKWTKFGNLMTSPKMRTAMMEAAKALDPNGFGGKLATSMGPIMAGEFENDYMSRVLAGEDPGKVGKDFKGVLSMDQMNSARDEVIKIAEQKRKQQATDETEDPAQKFFREMTGTAYKGGIALDVADKNYLGKMHSAVAASGNSQDKQTVTQAYKQLNSISDKLPVGVYTKDAEGNIVLDQDKWKQFLLSDDKPVTPIEIKAFIGAIEELNRIGAPTLGFENSLEDMKKLRDNTGGTQVAISPTPIKDETKQKFQEGDIREIEGVKYIKRGDNWTRAT